MMELSHSPRPPQERIHNNTTESPVGSNYPDVPPALTDEDNAAVGNIAHQLPPVTKRQQITILISSFLTVCITIGFNQSYGVFQSYYISEGSGILPAAQAKNSALVAFVGTLGAGLTWGGSVVVNPLMARSKDARVIPVVGVLLMSLGFGLASLSTEVIASISTN